MEYECLPSGEKRAGHPHRAASRGRAIEGDEDGPGSGARFLGHHKHRKRRVMNQSRSDRPEDCADRQAVAVGLSLIHI